jgi:polyisoprenoid-binding protein YceI
MGFFRRWYLSIPATVVVLVLAAGVGWWFFIRADADLATVAPDIPEDLLSPTPTPTGNGATNPSATVSPQPTVVLPPGTTRFTILPERSEAAYFAEETLASIGLPSRAKGATHDIRGDFYLRADGIDSSFESRFTVDLRTLKSDESRRDARVQDALDTDEYPEATFVVRRVDGFPTRWSAEEDSEFTMTGDLSIHGVTREVTWEVKAKREGHVMTALATVELRYADFNITPPNIAGFVSLTDTFTIQVQVVATASTSN